MDDTFCLHNFSDTLEISEGSDLRAGHLGTSEAHAGKTQQSPAGTADSERVFVHNLTDRQTDRQTDTHTHTHTHTHRTNVALQNTRIVVDRKTHQREPARGSTHERAALAFPSDANKVRTLDASRIWLTCSCTSDPFTADAPRPRALRRPAFNVEQASTTKSRNQTLHRSTDVAPKDFTGDASRQDVPSVNRATTEHALRPT